MRNKNDVAGGVNNVSCVIYRNGSTVGSASGTITVNSSGYYTLYPHAYVTRNGTTSYVTLTGQSVYLTYVAPQPSGTVHKYGAAYLYSEQRVSSEVGGYAIWYWSDDGGVPSNVAKDWGWTYMYTYEREKFYSQGYHHWYACTS